MATLQNTIQYRVYLEEFTLNFQHAFFQGVMKIIVKFCKRAILLFGTKVQMPSLFKLLSDISFEGNFSKDIQ